MSQTCHFTQRLLSSASVEVYTFLLYGCDWEAAGGGWEGGGGVAVVGINVVSHTIVTYVKVDLQRNLK